MSMRCAFLFVLAWICQAASLSCDQARRQGQVCAPTPPPVTSTNLSGCTVPDVGSVCLQKCITVASATNQQQWSYDSVLFTCSTKNQLCTSWQSTLSTVTSGNCIQEAPFATIGPPNKERTNPSQNRSEIPVVFSGDVRDLTISMFNLSLNFTNAYLTSQSRSAYTVIVSSLSQPYEGNFTVNLPAGVVQSNTAPSQSNTASDVLSNTVYMDNILPDCTVTGPNVSMSTTVVFKVNFTEVVRFGSPTLTFSGGPSSAIVNTSCSQAVLCALWFVTVTLSPASSIQAPLTLTVYAGSATDVVGNPNAVNRSWTVQFDNLKPSVTAVSAPIRTNLFNITYAIAWSEVVQSTPSNLSLSISSTISPNASFLTTQVSGCSGSQIYCTVYYVQLSMSGFAMGVGNITLLVNAGWGQDVAGNTNVQSGPVVVMFNNLPPVATFNWTQTRYQLRLTVTFDQPVQFTGQTGCPSVSNGSSAATLQTISSVSFAVIITPPMGTTGSVTALFASGCFQDLSYGNFNQLQTASGLFDTQPFLISVSHVPLLNGPTNRPILSFVFSAPRAFANLSNDVFSTSMRCVSIQAEGSGGTPSFALTMMPINTTSVWFNISSLSLSGNLTAGCAPNQVYDLYGNANANSMDGSGQLTIRYDNIRPQPVVSYPTTRSTLNSPIVVSFSFGELVQGFDPLLITVTPTLPANSSIVCTLGQNSVFICNVTVAAQGNASFSFPAGVISDLANNTNLASNILIPIQFDFLTVRPELKLPIQIGGVLANPAAFIDFVLPDLSPPSTSCFLIFKQNSTIVLNLSFAPTTTSSGDFFHRLKLQDPWTGGLDAPFVIAATGVNGSGPPGLAPGQIYNVTLTYQDGLANPPASDDAMNVLFIPLVTLNTLSPNTLACCGPINISFSGVFTAPGAIMNVSVSYASYNCPVVFSNSSFIMCTAPSGVGANMPVVVTLNHYAGLTIIGDSLSYSPPVISNGTLRSGGVNGSLVSYVIGSSRAGGDIVSFSGNNWGTNLNLISVQVGGFNCPLLYAQCNVSVLTCTTTSGTGNNLTFTVAAGSSGYLSVSNPSDFTYSYPAGPVVTAVQGCTNNNSTGETTQCPTVGNVSITLIGSRFPDLSSSLLVYVNYQPCAVTLNWTSSQIVCQLPAGTGLRRAVQVFGNQTVSPPALLLSYALPSMSSVQGGVGCAGQNTTGVSGCARMSSPGPLIRVQGSNFGAMDDSNSAIHAGLWVGLKPCTNLVHDAVTPHSQFTCNLPAGQGSVPLFIGQYDTIGFYPTNFTVSYESCPLGFEDGTDGSCVECTPGRRRGSQDAQCVDCGVGQYTSISISVVCFTCPSGTFSGSPGQSQCANCSAGSYSGVGAAVCAACPPGTWSDVPATTCSDCAPGTYSDSPGTVNCSTCDPGTISASGETRCRYCDPGLIATSPQTCGACAAGTYSNITSCVQCPPGTQSSYQSAQCQPCAQGRFSTVLGDACTECPAGRFGPNLGAVECQLCPLGTYQINIAQTVCQNCDYDTYSIVNGSVSCLPCPSGWVAQPGMTGCSQCEGGTYATENHVCEPCTAGRQSPNASTSCFDCEAGKYSDAGAEECTDCDAGKFLRQGFIVCTDCFVGLYADQQGMSACLECGSGNASWANASGCDSCPPGQEPRQNLCSPCFPGYFSNITGGLCVACPRGTAALDGATACEDCAEGRSNPTEGGDCQECRLGTYANTTRAVECKLCSPGYKSDISAASACSMCGVGQFSDEGASSCTDCNAGTFNSNTSQSICAPCAPGSYSLQAATICEPCVAGQFSATGGQCLGCDVGKYGPVPNLTACITCEAGKFQPQNSSSSCVLCDTGKFSNTQATQCEFCATARIAPNPGTGSCLACPSFSMANGLRDECLCNAGYYQTDNLNVLECVRCPKGANCEYSGVVTLVALDGYWQSRLSNESFYSCLYPSRCVNNGCSPLRAGPMCMNCIPGYKESAVEQSCGACSDIAENTGLYTSLLLVLAAVVIFCIYWVMLRRTDMELQKLQDTWGETLFGDWSMSGYDVSTVASTRRMTMNESARAGNIHFEPPTKKLPLWLQSKRAPSLVQKAKIVTSFFQIISSGFAQRVPWPAEYRSFSLGTGAIFNIDFVPWQRVNCALDIGFLAKSRLVSAIPLFFAVIIFIWYLLLLLQDKRRAGALQDKTFYNSLRVKSSVKIWKVSIVSVFLLYPYVSSTVLSVYNCRTVDDQSYLVRDFTVHCDPDSEWAITAYTNILFVIIYPIGVPVCSFLLLYFADLTDPLTIVKLGFLYQAFTIKCWYFELIDMLFKLTLTSLVEFFSLKAELRIALFLCTLYLVLVLLLNPFTQKGNDRLRQLALVELYLMGFIGVMLCMSVLGETNPTVSYGVTAVILVALPVLLTCWTLAISARNVQKLIQLYRVGGDKAEERFLEVTKTPPPNHRNLVVNNE